MRRGPRNQRRQRLAQSLLAGVVLAISQCWMATIVSQWNHSPSHIRYGLHRLPPPGFDHCWVFTHTGQNSFFGYEYVMIVYVSLDYATSTHDRQAPPRWSHAYNGPTATDLAKPDRYHGTVELAYGWPASSMMVTLRGNIASRNNPNRWTYSGGIPIRWLPFFFDDIYRSLPITPIWPGFVINVAFYTVAWALVIAPASRGTLAWARRRRAMHRIEDGLCPHCAYPMDKARPADAVCPECGKAAAPPR